MAYLKTLKEQDEKTAVFTYGRNNPPTVGHEKLFDKTMEVAKEHATKAHIFTSHSQDSKKNPLSAEHKVQLIKHAYPKAHVAASSKEMPSMLHIAKHLHKQGHQHLVMVAGSDRVKEYEEKLHQYNGTHEKAMYNFKSIKVVSAGHRDPDAEGAEGMSGTKLRSHAIAGNKEKFKSGLMSKLSDAHKEKVYNHVRKAMNVNEVYDPHLKISKFQWGEKEGTDHMKKMTPGQNQDKDKKIREQYVAGDLFKIGQLVETKDGRYGTVTYRGSNHVTISLKEGGQIKCWLTDLTERTEKPEFMPFRNRLKEQKVPVLLMTKEQRQQMVEETQQLEFDGIQTKHFDMCKDAYTLFNQMIKTVRAGKHVGEQTGHEPDKLPYPGAVPEMALHPAEIQAQQAAKGITPSSEVHKQVQAGIAMKPRRLRYMQYHQYTSES